MAHYLLIDGAETGPFTAEEIAEINGSASTPYEVVDDEGGDPDDASASAA